MKKESRPPAIKAENRDISRYIVWQYVKKALFTAIYIAMIAFSAVRVASHDNVNTVATVVIAAVFSAAAFFIFGWLKLLREEHTVGTLVRKGFRYETELPKGIVSKGDVAEYARAMVEGAEGSSLQKDIVYFFIETPDGKTVRKRYYDDGRMSFLFFDGDTVCVRRGLKYPQNLSAVHQESYLCVVCGNTVSDKTDVCPKCHHSIIKLDGYVPSDDEENTEGCEE